MLRLHTNEHAQIDLMFCACVVDRVENVHRTKTGAAEPLRAYIYSQGRGNPQCWGISLERRIPNDATAISAWL